jgi:hypothetical protein
MKNNLKLFQNIIDGIKQKGNKALELSMNHVHIRNMFSLVVKGTEFGKLTRIFIADEGIEPFEVQLHTHRYPIRISIIRGDITHHTAVMTVKPDFKSVKIAEYNYKSFINGGGGLEYVEDIWIDCMDYKLPIGSVISMGVDDYHTMSCSKGSIWIVEELGFQRQSSWVLGVPFITEGLYQQPAMFQINDKCQVVIKELRKIIESYRLTTDSSESS